MHINQIEPKFKELEKGVDGAMQQVGDLEKRFEQLALALQDHESASVYDAHVAAVGCPGEPEPDPEPVEDPPTEKVMEDPSSNDEASPEPNPEPAEESEDTDARFRQEAEVDAAPMVKVDIQTNLSGPAKQMLEQAIAEKIKQLQAKTGINAEIKITDG